MLSSINWQAATEGLAIVCVVLVIGFAIILRKLQALRNEIGDLDFQNRSLSTTYGRITEQWFPLMEAYPYDPQNFRFLGSPVDGVQFEEDRIVFVEFKTNRSRLSNKQRNLKRLVEEGYVYWEEFRFTDTSGEDTDVR